MLRVRADHSGRLCVDRTRSPFPPSSDLEVSKCVPRCAGRAQDLIAREDDSPPGAIGEASPLGEVSLPAPTPRSLSAPSQLLAQRAYQPRYDGVPLRKGCHSLCATRRAFPRRVRPSHPRVDDVRDALQTEVCLHHQADREHDQECQLQRLLNGHGLRAEPLIRRHHPRRYHWVTCSHSRSHPHFDGI